jgi:hypothetical protein
LCKCFALYGQHQKRPCRASIGESHQSRAGADQAMYRTKASARPNRHEPGAGWDDLVDYYLYSYNVNIDGALRLISFKN